jgi:hypothetical protein
MRNDVFNALTDPDGVFSPRNPHGKVSYTPIGEDKEQELIL